MPTGFEYSPICSTPVCDLLPSLRGQRILSNSKCQRDPDAQDLFSDELVEFGDSNRSHTKLLQIGDYANTIDKLYRIPAAAYP